jgi:hypothetical protein
VSNKKVDYQIHVTRTGEGARQAAAEMQQLGQAATGANAALNQMNASAQTGTGNSLKAFGRLQQQTSTLHTTFRALDGTLRVIGFSTFPRITMAVTAAVDGMRALTSAARAAAEEAARAATISAGASVGGSALGSAAGGAAGGAARNAMAGAAGGAAVGRGASLRTGFGIVARTAGPWAVIGAGAIAAGKYVKELWGYGDDLNALEQSLQNVEESARSTAQALVDLASKRMQSGDLVLSESEAARIDKLILQQNFRGARAAIDENTRPAFFMTEAQKAAEVRARLAALNDPVQRQLELEASVRAVEQPGVITSKIKSSQESIVGSLYLNNLAEITRLKNEGMITPDHSNELSDEAAIKRNNHVAQIRAQLTEMQQLGQAVTETFASGFSQAFVSFLDGTKSAKEAFGDFARSFLSTVAQMIMQQLVLNALQGVFGGAKKAASGGMFPRFAASGLAGVSSVSQATYFPKFNVVAGEAGHEMLTVLARPRMMELGGMQAVVGSAQGRQLAITDASSLAGNNGTTGSVNIRVTLGPELRAEIVQQSVKGAVVQVAQDMKQDTPISRGVKGLAA